jgi:hypothetical protein
MKKICLKSKSQSLFVSLFAVASILFFSIKCVEATTQQWMGNASNNGWDSNYTAWGQTFTAAHNNLLTFNWGNQFCSYLSGVVKICEVSALNSTTCLDTPVATQSISACPSYFTFAALTPLTVGHFYYAYFEGSASFSPQRDTTNPYAGGQSVQDGAGTDFVFWGDYDDAWTPPYCGNGICDGSETFSTCPQDCTASRYDSAVNLFFFNNPYLRNQNSTARISYQYNESVFTPYDYIEIFQLGINNWASSTSIGTSTIIDYNELGGRKQSGLSYFSLNGTSTYTGLIYYDVVAHFASYWDAGTGQTIPAQQSDPYVVVVDWTSEMNLPLPSWNFATTTVLGDEFDTHDLACTADEWAGTSSIPFLGINVDVAMCRYKQWLLDIGMKPTQFIIRKITGLRDQIMSMFPFSLFKTMGDSWKTSTDSLSSFLKTKSAYAAFSTSTGIYTDSGDGYTIDFPNFLGGGATSSLSVLSKSNMTALMGDYGFNVYYFICRFLVWAATLIYFWNLLTKDEII